MCPLYRNQSLRTFNKGGFALRGVGVRTPTSRRLRSVIFLIDGIHSFDIRYSLFLSFFSDQTGRWRPEAGLVSDNGFFYVWLAIRSTQAVKTSCIKNSAKSTRPGSLLVPAG